MARELEPLKPSWVEEPVPPENLAALKKASEKITIPVATGERIHTRYEYRQLFELQAADISSPTSPTSVASSKRRSLLPGLRHTICWLRRTT